MDDSKRQRRRNALRIERWKKLFEVENERVWKFLCKNKSLFKEIFERKFYKTILKNFHFVEF